MLWRAQSKRRRHDRGQNRDRWYQAVRVGFRRVWRNMCFAASVSLLWLQAKCLIVITWILSLSWRRRDEESPQDAGAPVVASCAAESTHNRRNSSALFTEPSNLQASPLLRMEDGEPVDQDHLVAAPGDVISEFRLDSEIGRGAYAVVWKAERRGKEYALKVSRPGALYRRQCEREFEVHQHLIRSIAAEQLRNIAVFTESFYFTSNHKKWFVLVGNLYGRSLLDDISIAYDAIHRGPGDSFDLYTVKKLLRDILTGLSLIHDLSSGGVVHCDLKPENILHHNGSALLADFGAAHVINGIADGPERTDSTLLLQTREYRAPEVIAGLPVAGSTLVSPSLDIWSFGCIAFELLTGTYLFNPKSLTGGTDEGFSTDVVHFQMIVDLCWSPKFDGNPLFRRGSCMASGVHCAQLEPLLRFHPGASDGVLKQLLVDRNPLLNDADLCASFLLMALRLTPTRRGTARELLGHPWLL